MRKHGTKTTLVFLPADGETSWLLLSSLVSLLSDSTEQPENTYSRILQVLEHQNIIKVCFRNCCNETSMISPCYLSIVTMLIFKRFLKSSNVAGRLVKNKQNKSLFKEVSSTLPLPLEAQQISLFHMGITVSVTKSSHRDRGPTYLHLRIFFFYIVFFFVAK